MALFCIPKNLVENLKNSALKGEVDIKKLYEMSSEERRDFFAKHTDGETGKLINTEFEKAMISKQKTALTDWAKSVFDPKSQSKTIYKNVVDKINSLDELGVLDPKGEKAFLEDLVADKLGVNVSAEEVRIINEKAKVIDSAQGALGKDLGNPEKLQENIDFFKAKKQMDDYLLSLTPASKLKIATGTIGRGMMLFSIKSPLLNIGSNLEVGMTEALSRRLAIRGYKGADNALAVKYVKMVNKIYQSTGYDISRMTSLKDTGASGARVLGNDTVHAQGKGAIRFIGRKVFEDVVFKQLMGAPDAAFASAHFADSVNLNSLKMTKGDKVAAREIMNDAMKLEPETPKGSVLRDQGMLDAQIATWTNKTWVSKISEGIRKILNEASGDWRAGDYLLPFVKTPANVIATGMDYAGGGAIKAIITATKAFKAGEIKNPEVLQSICRDIVRSGIGLTGAFVIANQLQDDDFVGAYDPARAQMEQLKNSNYNAIRLNGKWVSVDWLGPLAIPVTAMMYSRKYGKKGIQEMGVQYAKWTLSAVGNAPGISDMSDYFTSNSYKKDQTLEEMTGEAGDYAISEISSRLIPSFISDYAKATDQYERKTSGAGEALQAKFPGVREALPIKTNIFGEQIKTEPWWSVTFFGARFKSDKTNNIIKELQGVSSNNDKGINFTDWDKSSAKNLTQFKEKVGPEKFKEAKVAYGQELKKQLSDTFNKGSYQRLSDEEKLKVINSMDADAMDKIFKKYGFKYKADKTKKINL